MVCATLVACSPLLDQMVMGAHRERTFLLNTQPHLTQWLPIAVPLNRWIMWPPPFKYPPAVFGALGLFPLFFKFYDSLCKFSCPGSYILSKSRALREFPQLDKDQIKYCQVQRMRVFCHVPVGTRWGVCTNGTRRPRCSTKANTTTRAPTSPSH